MYEIECLTQQNEEVASVEDCSPFLGGCYPEADVLAATPEFL